MVHTYQVNGMSCVSCETKIKSALLMIGHVTAVDISREKQTATITMDKHIPLSDLQNGLSRAGGQYHISLIHQSSSPEESISWLSTYMPVLLIFVYITGITLLIQAGKPLHFDVMLWMRHFMAGFFLVFSFFKLLNLKGFADSYRMYDLLAKRIAAWAYIYPFIELGLGVAYLLDADPFLTNWVTTVVMTISIIGVLQTVLNKKKIQCACLGAVFNLPMSTITIIEDGIMIAMSIAMLLLI